MMVTWKSKPRVKANKAVTIFIDHASRFINLTMCKSTNGEEALNAMLCFEKLANDSGVQVKQFRADNRVFASNSFKISLAIAEQEINFCGLNAHFRMG